MKNAFFEEDDLKIIQSAMNLRVTTSHYAEIAPIKPDKKYKRWINHNSSIHQHPEMMVVLAGTGCFTLNGSTYQWSPGTCFLIDSDESHDSYYPPYFDNFRHLWLRIVNRTILTGTPYQKINGTVGNARTFSYTFSDYNPAARLFMDSWSDMTSENNIPEAMKFLCLKNAFAGILLELCKAGYGFDSGKHPTEEHHRTVINAIAGHIRETGGRNLDIGKLAHIAGYSKFHFARIFKKITGHSVLDFINQSRADKYKELSAVGLNKKQISSELGFSCPAAFSRWLRETFTP